MPFIPYNAFLANKIQHLGLHLVRVLGLAGRLLLGTTTGPMVFVFYLSDVWLNVNPNTNIEGKCVFKRLNYVLNICWSFMTHIQIIGGTIIWPCNKKKISTLTMNQIFMQPPKQMRKMTTGLDLEFLVTSRLALVFVCIITYEKWVQS